MCFPSDKLLIEYIFKFLNANIGILLPSPNGSNCFKLSTVSLLTSLKLIFASIFIIGIISSIFASLAIFSNSFAKSLNLSFFIVIPIAMLCPPNLSIVSWHFINASCKSNPGILLPDPFAKSSS